MHHTATRTALLTIMLCALFVVPALAAAPLIEWQKILGGSTDDSAHAIDRCTDGGYILVGDTYSPVSRDIQAPSHGSADIWVVRLSAARSILWQQRLGGIGFEEGHAVQQTSDGGFIVAGGSSSSMDGDVQDQNNGPSGSRDAWVVKLSANGVIEWQKLYGGSMDEIAMSVDECALGGYIVLGKSNSPVGGDISSEPRGRYDYWAVRLYEGGAVAWERRLGGDMDDFGMSVQHTADDGHILAGTSWSSQSGDVTDYGHGSISLQPTAELWVVKIGPYGEIRWQNLLGGWGQDYAESVTKTADGGYLVVGRTDSATEEITDPVSGGEDALAVKLNGEGAVQWLRTLGGPGRDNAVSVAAGADGGFFLLGESESSPGGDVSGTNHGQADLWAVKLSGAGALQWSRLLGGAATERAGQIVQAADGGIVIAGASRSTDGDVSGKEWNDDDYWTVKLAPEAGLPAIVPGGTGIPTDLNVDSKYEDVNGNGRTDFADVVLYFTQMSWITANEPMTAFDYNANGRVDFADVVWLFSHL